MSVLERTFHVLPFFHYDVAYLRTREEYLATAFGLLDMALAWMEADAAATFLVESPYLLDEWLKVRPNALEPLRRLAQEGRLEIAPGMWVMADMAIPSGEWLSLQTEAGFDWCRETLGVRPSVCWMPAPWNHPPTLPQWLNKCGYSAYVFSRGADRHTPNHFRWRGLNGSETLAVRMPFHYDVFPPARVGEPDAEARFLDVLGRLDAAFPPGQPALVPMGADFAAPNQQSGALLAKMRERGIRVHFSTLARFVADLRKHWSELPTLPADFSPMFQGTFSSRIGLKQANRRVESAADRLWRYESAGGATDEWRGVLPTALRHQFHDTICGAIIDPCAEEAATDYARIEQTLRAALPAASRAEERHVFNPSVEAREGVVFLPHWKAVGAAIGDAPVPLQAVPGGAAAYVRVPPLCTVSLRPSQETVEPPDTVTATETRLENGHVRVELDAYGNITQVTLKSRQGETPFLSGERPLFNTLAFEHDYGDFWSLYRQPTNGTHIFRTPYADTLALEKDPAFPGVDAAGSFSDAVPKPVAVAQGGSLRGRLRIAGSMGLRRWKLDFEQTITLDAGSARIAFHTVLRPSAKFARVRVAFRPVVKQARVRCHVPYGVAERGVSEHAAQNGVALHGSQTGMLLLNRGLPGSGWDGETLTLSLLRCVAMEYKGASETGYETGTTHRFDYAVLPFRATDPPDLCRESDRFLAPLLEVSAAVPGPPWQWDASENVNVTRVEPMPDGYRLHGHETMGRAARAALRAPGATVVPVDVTGEPVGAGAPDEWKMTLGPYEIFMLRVVY